jgi:cystathionine beta-lyase
VDNSLLSPILQRPLALGAHLVVHSATKALCGHGDVLAGAVVTDAPNLHERIAFHLNAEGAGLAPFDSWLLLRGMKTLALRIERQCATARTVASFLIAHPDTRQVFYPGLGPVVSFTTGDPERSRRLVEAARLFTIAVSFGSVTSSISLPCHMSHASVPAELRDRLAPPADLVRLSVGIEDEDDLLDDLRQAFGVAASGVRSLSAPPAGTRSEVFAAPASCTPD